ncbi:MAG TPA: IS110 family transposase [Bacteroidota bacterium]|jgi:transposase|nr:IS110 family transposase [Bacteroidota bacterium]
MHSQYTQVNFTGQDVNVGLDVSNRSWKVAIYLGTDLHKRFVQEPNPKQLMHYLQRNFPGAKYHIVYEAGYNGFWSHDELESLGADCIVVNPADVPTSDKERRHKNDRVDADKLCRNLATKTLKPIFVPERSWTEDRILVRTRNRFVRKQTRVKCQIKALLAFYGYQMPEEMPQRYWSRRYINWIASLQMTRPSGETALKALLNELEFLRRTIVDLTRQIRLLAQDERYRAPVDYMQSISGISLLAAMTFLTEIVTIDRFKKSEHLASFVGIVPGEHSSGDQERTTGLVPRGNKMLRYMLIECAWIAQREDPALLQAFQRLCKRMAKTDAIIRIARKLLNRIWFVLKHRQRYVTGVA